DAAFCASSPAAISTNAKPRARPGAGSRMPRTDSTVPARLNSSCSSASPVVYGRFPTYSLRPIVHSSFAPAAHACSMPSPNLGGCCAADSPRRLHYHWEGARLEARSALGAGEAGGADHQGGVVYQRLPTRSQCTSTHNPAKSAILGSERLLASSALDGRCVGVVCNPASVDRQLRHIADRLAGHPSARLAAIFGPQHGFRSDVQDNMIETGHAHDEVRRVPIYSLYS